MTDETASRSAPRWDFDERWLQPGAIVPIDIHTASALLGEVRRLRALSSSIGAREKLEEIASALDKVLGDSDLTHIENEDELREVAPVQWACAEINKLLQTAPRSTGSSRDPEAILERAFVEAMEKHLDNISDFRDDVRKAFKKLANRSASRAPLPCRGCTGREKELCRDKDRCVRVEAL